MKRGWITAPNVQDTTGTGNPEASLASCGSATALFSVVPLPASHIAGLLFDRLGAARAAEVRDALSALIAEDGGGADAGAVPA